MLFDIFSMCVAWVINFTSKKRSSKSYPWRSGIDNLTDSTIFNSGLRTERSLLSVIRRSFSLLRPRNCDVAVE